MKRILISAAGGPVAVNVIKYLKEQGYFVIGMDSNSDVAAKFICDKFYSSPIISEPNKQKYINLLKSIEFDIFYPWLDEELKLISEKEFPESLKHKIIISPPSTINLCLDKILFHSYCTSKNILVPSKTDSVPAFIRHRYSRGSKGAQLIIHKELLSAYRSTHDILSTEFIDGDEFTIDVLTDNNGQFMFAVPRQRIISSNVSLCGRVNMDDELIEYAKHIVQKFKFRGPINIQVIRSNKKIYMIEINPRISGTCILSIEAGFDLFKEQFTLPTIKNGLVMYRYFEELYK